jgi:hypothetical protein
MNRHIYFVGKQRVLDSLREHASRAEFLDRPRAIDVAVRRDFDELDGVPESRKFTRHPLRLPTGKRTAARSESKFPRL